MKKLQYWAFVVCAALGLAFPASGEVMGPAASGQRYVSLMLLNLSTDGAPEQQLINMAHQYGMNSVHLTVHWDMVYYNSPTDTPRWDRFDRQIQLIASLGMSVAIRVQVARNKHRLNGFWDWDKDGMKDHAKVSQMGVYQSTTFRYNHEQAVRKAADFVKEVTTRYKWLQDQNKLLFVSVTNTPEQEAGYPYENFEPDTDTPKIYRAIYECSDQSIAEFRAWIAGHYRKIQRLNLVWGTNFESFETAGPHLTEWEPLETFRLRYGKDWYRFRHEVLKRYTDTMVDAVKSVDRNIRYVSDYGSVFDLVSSLRGTVAFGHLNENSDGVKINDAPEFDNRFTMDVLRGGLPEGAFLANEVFVRDNIPFADAEGQLNDNFSHGADMVTFVISTVNSMSRMQSVIRSAVANWQSKPKTKLEEKETIHYSLVNAVEKGIQNLIYSHWRDAALKDPANPQIVRLLPGDDLMTDSYWNVTANRPPYLKVPLPMQIVAIGRDFSFSIPENTFGDLDGVVEKIEFTDLPGWISYDGKTLRGKSDVLGDTRLAVRATDDEGGTFTAYLTIRIDTRENANKPPVLNLHPGDLAIKVNETFTYDLPAGMFRDEDGTVVRIEALEKPQWLSFDGTRLSGFPSQLGEFRLVLKAYDDFNAFVETYLTIRVMEPQALNAAPFVRHPIPIQYGPEGEPFSYVISTDTFGDGDGYIASVVMMQHPTWLSINFNRIYGTPPAEGEYKFFLRAYDNYGAFVDMPFILRIEKPFLRFTLQKAGSISEPEVIKTFERGEVFFLDSLPEKLNISAVANYPVDRVILRVSGPFEYESGTRRAPFVLYTANTGFEPFIGRYTVTGEAYNWSDSLLFVSSSSFSISGGSLDDLTGDMPVWTAYPVPFRDVINVKTDAGSEKGPYSFSVVTAAGQQVQIPPGFITTSGNLSQLNISKTGLTSGVYFVVIEQNGAPVRRIKVVKF